MCSLGASGLAAARDVVETRVDEDAGYVPGVGRVYAEPGVVERAEVVFDRLAVGGALDHHVGTSRDLADLGEVSPGAAANEQERVNVDGGTWYASDIRLVD